MSGIIRSRRICCVVGCSNNESKNPELQFYRFPGKNYEEVRKKQWITAVRRVDSDGKPWVASSESRVCSAHFVGGKKSENMHDLAYLPTIFPEIYRKKAPKPSRNERAKRRRVHESLVFLQTFPAFEDVEISNNENQEKIDTTETTDYGVQTVPCTKILNHGINTLYCLQKENDASTQTNIYIEQPPKSKIILDAKLCVTTKDKRCGPEEPMNPGFTGYHDVRSDTTMRQLAGVTRAFFSVLLDLLETGKDGQPKFYRQLGNENRLLLFLMKIKLGVTFCALGCFFHVHSTTAGSIFYSVLDTLTMKTKSWIFWPSKESVRKNLPKSFNKYPNCRCIIDCTEMPVETPPTIEQRVLMYSNYKGRFTVKFLIAITPDGYICKVSKAYGGRSTDSFITNDCGFLNLLEPNDLVLADKGFPQIQSELNKRNAILVIPPFAFNPQFTEEEVETGYNIASVRIHVERIIQRIKLSGISSHITNDLLPQVDSIMHVCDCK